MSRAHPTGVLAALVELVAELVPEVRHPDRLPALRSIGAVVDSRAQLNRAIFERAEQIGPDDYSTDRSAEVDPEPDAAA